jgi:hypothetical protein
MGGALNLRILKKLSARAAPLLPLLGDTRRQFRAARQDNYTGLEIKARKHFERMRSVHGEPGRAGSVKRPARDGRGWVYAYPPVHPREGTIMVGATFGYYEPEWDEETAWEALATFVYHHLADWNEDGPVNWPTFRHPGEIFTAAQRLIAERGERR